MGRTPGHPWVGESVPLDWANAYTGPPLALTGAGLRYRIRRDYAAGDTHTLGTGDSFIAGFYESVMMLSGDDVVAQFVLVCDGAGTIRLSGGTDPDWSLDDPADATAPMGTHTVAGPTVVVGDPFPTFDVDAYLAQVEETIVFVECLSGAIEINQVKLRLWPPGGPVGGWVEAPGFDVTEAPSARIASRVDPDELGTGGAAITGAAPGPVFAAAANELVNDADDADKMQDGGGGGAISTIQAAVTAQVAVGEDSDTPGVFTATSIGALTGAVVQQPDPLEVARVATTSSFASHGEVGLDVTWAPDEVPGDFAVDLLGDPSTAWGTYTLTTNALTIYTDGSGGSATVHALAVPDEAFVDPSLVTFPAHAGVDVAALSSSTGLSLPDARTVLVSLAHPFLVAAPLYGGTAGAWNVGSTTIVAADLEDSTVTIPNYRYWAPNAVATVRRVLRQLHRDDGQGIAPRRAYGGASRTHTRRAYGYD
jgi:hypothetical protein